MIILGIDPGLATTGIGVIEKKGSQHLPLHYSAIITTPSQLLPDRLLNIHHQLTALIDRFQPQTAAVEELFFNKNVTTALTVGQARGVILLTCAKAGLSVFGYTPLQVKTAICGYGRAEKKQVQFMVRKLLNLDHTPKPDDAADGLALAICHGHMHRIQSIL